MNDTIIVEKIEKIFYECDKHLLRIKSSAKELEPLMPLDKDSYVHLNDDNIQALDQFLFRFSKLQDAMGQKLFKTILMYLDEDVEGKPFIDILNMMEKFSLINRAHDWKQLRDDRNELAHNYEDEPEEMSENINTLFQKRVLIENIYSKIKTYYINKSAKSTF